MQSCHLAQRHPSWLCPICAASLAPLADDSNHSGNDPVACWLGVEFCCTTFSNPWYTTKPIDFCCAWVGPASAPDLRTISAVDLFDEGPLTLSLYNKVLLQIEVTIYRSVCTDFPWSSETVGRPVAIHPHSNRKVVWLSGPCKSSGGCKPSPAEMVQLKQWNSRRPIFASKWIVLLAPTRVWKHDTWNEETIVWREEALGFQNKRYLPKPLL